MRPRGLRASDVLEVATAAITAEKRAGLLTRIWDSEVRDGRGQGFRWRRRGIRWWARRVAKARMAAVELHDAYEAAIARWEWWDEASGPGKLHGFKLRADGHPSLWSTDPVRDRLRDRRRIGLGI